jgi:hypothetical protein
LRRTSPNTPCPSRADKGRRALSRCRFEGRIQEVGPLLVGTPDDVGWPKAFGTVASSVPVDQAKTRFIESQNLQRLLGLWAADPPCSPSYLIGEVFLKASCSSRSAFSWRGLPVLSLTFRRRRSCPTPSGWAYSMPRFLRNSSACPMGWQSRPSS